MENSDWQHFRSMCEVIYPKDIHSFNERYWLMEAFVSLGWAITSKGNEEKSLLWMIASWAYHGSYFLISKKARDAQFHTFFSECNEEKTMEVVKIAHKWIPWWYFKFCAPNIKFHKTLFIPWIGTELTIDGLQTLLNNFIDNKVI